MKKLKVAAFFEEFPFLSQHVSEEQISSVKVSRIDSEFLELKREVSGGGLWAGIGNILLLDRDGGMLAQVGLDTNPPPCWKFWDKNFWNRVSDEESVGEALLRISPDLSAKASLALRFFGERLVLYKAPKKFTIQEWIKEQTQHEETKLRSAVSAIDDEAK